MGKMKKVLEETKKLISEQGENERYKQALRAIIVSSGDQSDIVKGMANVKDLAMDLIQEIQKRNYGKGITVNISYNAAIALQESGISLTKEEFAQIVEEIYRYPWQEKYDWNVVKGNKEESTLKEEADFKDFALSLAFIPISDVDYYADWDKEEGFGNEDQVFFENGIVVSKEREQEMREHVASFEQRS